MSSFGPEILAAWYMVVGLAVYLFLSELVLRDGKHERERGAIRHPINVLFIAILWPIHLLRYLYGELSARVAVVLLMVENERTFNVGNRSITRLLRKHRDHSGIQNLGNLALKMSRLSRRDIRLFLFRKLVWVGAPEEDELERFLAAGKLLNRMVSSMEYLARHPEISAEHAIGIVLEMEGEDVSSNHPVGS